MARPGASTPARTAVFAALGEVLTEKPWRKVRLEEVAQRAGVSRQTIYNDFGSRYGLAEAYAYGVADALCDLIAGDMAARADDPRAALESGLRMFFEATSADPLIRRVQEGEAHEDLMRLVTSDSGPLLTHIADRLAASISQVWPGVDADVTRTLARTIARLAISYVALPPETDDDVASGLAALLAPTLERAAGERG